MEYCCPYKNDMHSQHCPGPSYVTSDVYIPPPVSVQSISSDTPSVHSIPSSSLSDNRLFRKEETMNQLKCQQNFLDQLESEKCNENYNYIAPGRGGVVSPSNEPVPQVASKQKSKRDAYSRKF